MVVMESVCASAIPSAAAAAAAAVVTGGGGASEHPRAWYDSSGNFTQGAAATSDDLADAYFKGQNYFSQVQGAYQGMSHGLCLYLAVNDEELIKYNMC